jgi:HEPN domain-containing protein
LAFKESFFEWTCFLCEQAAEKALKAISELLGKKKIGRHSTRELFENLPSLIYKDKAFCEKLLEYCYMVDQHVTRSRYPDMFDSGTPMDHYGKQTAKEVIRAAEEIIRFARIVIINTEKAFLYVKKIL